MMEQVLEEQSGEEESLDKFAYTKELQNTIKFWYQIIRTLAIVGMMSVLVYIGIRILLSSTAEQKSKYKELLNDWLIGMVLLFTMHYIMVFANIAVDNLTDLLKNINPMGHVAIVPDENGAVEKELRKWNFEFTETANDDGKKIYKNNGGGHPYIEWHTDLMGQLRIALQHNRDNSEEYIGYTIMYIVMVIYTFVFCLTYIKRVIYMAFLTVISPLVALTYPIDKVNDGSAQGFSYWFKEYIFNLLLQPLHLLIYTILISSAISFATKNIIYALVALGFITQAEKIVRQMFNFSKASTPGVFSGPAGAAMVMSGMRWLMGNGPSGANGGGKLPGASGESGTVTGNESKYMKTKIDTENELKGLAGANNQTGQEITNVGRNVRANRVNSSISEENRGESTSSSLAERMRDAELEETPYIPDMEQLQMWDNDIRNGDNSSDGMNYSDEEYRQILRDSGYNDEDIAQIMGDSNSTSLETESTIQDQSQQSTELASEDETEVQTQNTDGGEIAGEENGDKRSIKRAIGNTLSEYGEGMSYKIAQSIYNARPGRTLGKAAGAAFFGSIGIAAGVASGDLKNVGTYGVAGVAGGAKLGGGIVNSVSNTLHVDGLDETAARAYYGEEEFQNQAREALILKKARQKETIDRIQEKQKVSRKEARKLAETYARDYMKEKIYDVDDWISIEKLKGKKVLDDNGQETGRKYTREQAIAVHKEWKRSDIASKDEDKGIAKVQTDLNIKDKKRAKAIYNNLKRYDDIRNG